MNLSRRLLILGSAALLAGSLAGCSSDTPTAQTTPTPTRTLTTPLPTLTVTATPTPAGSASGTLDTCAAADQAKLSLSDVKDVNIRKEGTAAFKAKVATLKTDVDAAVAAAKVDFAPQGEAVQEAMATLDTAVAQLGSSPSAESVKAVGTALDGVTTSVTALTSAMDDAC